MSGAGVEGAPAPPNTGKGRETLVIGIVIFAIATTGAYAILRTADALLRAYAERSNH